ncbi:MAG TPA: DUF2752 domain-containing protein [Bacteroidales bacterium]|nr:DUF2752 domain-containing protein [Bacteroidales bacterium]
MKKFAFKGAYFTVNIILAGVILLIMGYSVYYSPDKNDYPVVCFHEKITGQPCPSCGLSHAFSLIVRGRFDEAIMWNQYSVRVFIFFLVQFIIRLVMVAYIYRKVVVAPFVPYLDATISIIMVIAAFYPFLLLEWRMLF